MCVNSLIEVLSIEVINELLMPTLLRHNFELNHFEKETKANSYGNITRCVIQSLLGFATSLRQRGLGH